MVVGAFWHKKKHEDGKWVVRSLPFKGTMRGTVQCPTLETISKGDVEVTDYLTDPLKPVLTLDDLRPEDRAQAKAQYPECA